MLDLIKDNSNIIHTKRLGVPFQAPICPNQGTLVRVQTRGEPVSAYPWGETPWGHGLDGAWTEAAFTTETVGLCLTQ